MASMAFAHGSKKRNLAECRCNFGNDGQLGMWMQAERVTSALNMSRLGMNDRVLAYLVSLGIIGAGVIWIVAGTYSAASELCIAIGLLTIAVGWISFMVEFRNKVH